MLPIDTGAKHTPVQDSYLNQDALNSVKAMGRDKDPQAIKEVAKKFEAMFVQQMLKSMRAANDVFAEGSYFNSDESRFHRDMMDEQLVLNLTSGQGMGIANQLYQQMMQNYGDAFGEKQNTAEEPQENGLLNAPAVTAGMLATAVVLEAQPRAMKSVANLNLVELLKAQQLAAGLGETEGFSVEKFKQSAGDFTQLLAASRTATRSPLSSGGKAGIAGSPEEFVAILKPHAEKAAAELNLDPEVLIAQVALETGWGKHVIHTKQGANSFNLFNIKAGSRWQGDKINVSTLEYKGGVAAQEKADFRQYTSYADSFSDYVNLLKNNPRYEKALSVAGNSSAYAEQLEAAGYATDPNYAEKIKRLLNSDVIRAAQSLGDTSQELVSFINNLTARQGE
jgi:peptidoglycan hydrolase FlgJ